MFKQGPKYTSASRWVLNWINLGIIHVVDAQSFQKNQHLLPSDMHTRMHKKC